uniref:Uncharacterized protein n=1 Tax=Chrysemys picta bellii TaxID=8478 RepID=A0A8C3PF41_CHRPI
DRAGRSSRPGTSPARQAPDPPPECGAGLCAHRERARQRRLRSRNAPSLQQARGGRGAPPCCCRYHRPPPQRAGRLRRALPAGGRGRGRRQRRRIQSRLRRGRDQHELRALRLRRPARPNPPAARRQRSEAAAAMGERPRAQPGAPPAAAAPSGSLLNGLLHNGFHPPPLLRQEPPVPGHGSPAKKCRLRRRLDSGRRNRPRNSSRNETFGSSALLEAFLCILLIQSEI